MHLQALCPIQPAVQMSLNTFWKRWYVVSVSVWLRRNIRFWFLYDGVVHGVCTDSATDTMRRAT